MRKLRREADIQKASSFINNDVLIYVTSSDNQKWIDKKKDYSEYCEASLVTGILCEHPYDCKYAINITPDTELHRETKICCGRHFKPFERIAE